MLATLSAELLLRDTDVTGDGSTCLSSGQVPSYVRVVSPGLPHIIGHKRDWFSAMFVTKERYIRET